MVRTVVFLLIISLWPATAGAGLIDETRLCGPPARNTKGEIVRRYDVLLAFQRLYPRPQDGRRWYMDHVIPLSCGGCDSVTNLQWMHESAWRDKSRWERKVYGGHGISMGCP